MLLKLIKKGWSSTIIDAPFDIHDKVRVIDGGETYSSYYTAMCYFKIEKSDLFNRSKYFGFYEDDGLVYEVKDMVYNGNGIIIYLIQSKRGYLMITQYGIDFVNSAYKRKGEYRDETGKSNAHSINYLTT